MTFKDIKEGYSLHLLDRDSLKYSEVKVASVSLPRFENKIGQPACMVIDVTVDVDGKPLTHSFNQDLSKAYQGTLLVATDKKDILSDIKAIKTSSERALNEVEHHNEVLTKCNQLLSDLDTEFKEKKEMETKLDRLEKMVLQLVEATNKKIL